MRLSCKALVDQGREAIILASTHRLERRLEIEANAAATYVRDPGHAALRLFALPSRRAFSIISRTSIALAMGRAWLIDRQATICLNACSILALVIAPPSPVEPLYLKPRMHSERLSPSGQHLSVIAKLPKKNLGSCVPDDRNGAAKLSANIAQSALCSNERKHKLRKIGGILFALTRRKRNLVHTGLLYMRNRVIKFRFLANLLSIAKMRSTAWARAPST